MCIGIDMPGYMPVMSFAFRFVPKNAHWCMVTPNNWRELANIAASSNPCPR